MRASAEGTLVVNPANPYMADFEYDVTFTGGTGSLAGAHGSGKLHDGMVMFTTIDLVQPDDTTVPPEPPAPPAGSNTGKACWLLDGDLDYYSVSSDSLGQALAIGSVGYHRLSEQSK